MYELRTYGIIPAHFPAFLQFAADKYHLRTAHSPMWGFWTPEMGAQNQVVHLWQYDSLTQRQEVRAALAKDDKWKSEYLAPTRHMVDWQVNELLLPLEGAAVVSTRSSDRSAGAAAAWFYYLRREPVAEDGSVTASPRAAGVEPCGEWLTAASPSARSKLTLLRSRDADRLVDCIAAHAPVVDGASGKLLTVAEPARRNAAVWQ